MCRHLEELNNDAVKQIQELRNELAQTDSGLNNLRGEVTQSKGNIRRLDERLDSAAASLEATRIEVAGCKATCKEMGNSISQNAKGIGRLQDGQKSTSGTMQKMKEEAIQRDEDIGKLRQDLEELRTRMNDTLEEKVHQLDTWVEQLLQDHGNTKKTVLNNKENLRGMGCELRGTQEDLSKVASDVKRLVKHLNDMTNKLDGTESSLGKTNTQLQKLHVDHDGTKTNTQVLQVNLQGVATKLQRLNDDHLKTNRNVGFVREGLDKVSAYHEETRELLNRTLSEVKELQEGHGDANATMNSLSKNLERVHGLASSTQKDLKLTNALVLPNLNADSGTGDMSMPVTPSTTRNKKILHGRPVRLDRI